MALGQGILAGKKTYITAALGILTAVAGYVTGTIEIKELVEAIFIGITAMTMRAGITKSGPADKPDVE